MDASEFGQLRAHSGGGRQMAVGHVDAERQVAAAGELNQLAALALGPPQRLLTEHVPSRLQRAGGLGRMQSGGRGDDDPVDGQLEQRVELAVH